MLKFVSTLGGAKPVDFETAILNGYAPDGGLYVPEKLPQISLENLKKWSYYSYTELAFEILSLFIDRKFVGKDDLKNLIEQSFSTFNHKEVLPLVQIKNDNQLFIMELFHGPTLSFKDVAMGFLVNLFDFFLKRKGENKNILVATTGDTGPAAAYASIGKTSLNTWLLYPKGLITEEQERQMTTLVEPNIHAVAVEDCPDGGDDLDLVISQLMDNKETNKKYNISSVNSINWGRVMVQTIHYFYGYLKVVDKVGEKISFSVPSGAFGNMCAGTLAREMGLPVEKFICATNENATLSRIFNEGLFIKKELVNTPSSAIDIILPYNFWRFLYFITGQDPNKLKSWTDTFKKTNKLQFDESTHITLSKGFLSKYITSKETLELIKSVFLEYNYLMDPHLSVAFSAALSFQDELPKNGKLICIATAHPSKFRNSILEALGKDELPEQAKHESIEKAKEYFNNILLCKQPQLHKALIHALENTLKVNG